MQDCFGAAFYRLLEAAQHGYFAEHLPTNLSQRKQLPAVFVTVLERCS
jgi:hypothetical protein